MNQPSIERVLIDARKRDEQDPIAGYVSKDPRRKDPNYYCRVCGPRQEDVTPFRVSDVHALPMNVPCDACHQPLLRP